ncbi:MAG: hypothetical protein ABL967_01585 [Bryobacteraceae bacterium]
MATQKEGSFVRWQCIRIAQFGHVANLILTFAVASLGFSVTLLQDLRHGRSAPCLLCIWAIADFALLGSIALGILCAMNRLWDFRETAQIARRREDLEQDGKLTRQEIDARLEYQREANRKRGELSWTLFYWQIGTFGVGIVFLLLAFVFSLLVNEGPVQV